MRGCGIVVAGALALWIAAAMPLLSRRAYRRFLRAGTDPGAKIRLYRRSAAHKWAIVLAIVVAWLLLGAPDAVIWVRAATWWLAAELLIGMAIGALVARRRLRSPTGRSRLARQAEKFQALLPHTTAERREFAFFALNAGITEEIAYRAFLLPCTMWLLDTSNPFLPLLIVAAVFGLAHLYQGWKGIAQTAVLGLLLGLLYIASGLITVIVIHALFDIRLLLLPSDLRDDLPSSDRFRCRLPTGT